MVSHIAEFKAHTSSLASSDRYVRFLHDIAETSGREISPRTLRNEADIECLAARLTGYSEKSVRNYKSVMRKYLEMVRSRGL
jgi:hypothetical protein